MRRNGLTVIEVLVLLVILVIVLGVLMSFLGSVRESAGVVQCSNNLRIIGEGIHHYQGEIPQMFLEGFPGPPLPAARIADGYASWAVQLAPYLDGKSPLKDWDMRQSYFDQPAGVRAAIVPWFYCPARNRPGRFSIRGDVSAAGEENLPGAVGDYACASGDGNPRFPWDSAQANGPIILGEVLERKGNLILRWQARTDFASLQRGLSNTILIGEKHVPADGFGQAEFGDGSLYNGGQPASFARVGGPGFGLAQSPSDPFNNNFGSYHPGLCQFLMADDSVRPMANKMNEDILGQIIRRE